MNLEENSLAPRTCYDLNFRIGDVPVRVHPYFWLSTVFLGLDTNRKGADILIYLFVWAALEFVSVLVHEMGHILMGRYYGNRGYIILTGFCGLAVGASDLPERKQRIAVSLAGPGAGFLLAAVVAGLYAIYDPAETVYLLGALINLPDHFLRRDDMVQFTIYYLLWINVYWGLVNLLPIWPLDGGHVCREICQAFRGREGMRLSAKISLVTAGGLAVLAFIEWVKKAPLIPFLSFGTTLFAAIFFGILAYSGWQLLKAIGQGALDWENQENEPRAPWERDADWWKRGDNSWQD